MKKDRRTLLFDKNDFDLMEIVNGILARRRHPGQIRKLFDPYLHPRGIKEMAAPKSFRIAYAMVELLGTLEKGTAEDRTSALRVMIAETLHAGNQNLRRNVARVLLQIMKALIRAHGDEDRQLVLAHDFHEACSGKPRLVRKLLRKYQLLEMPEAWNHLAFDHHVHDASTKGRKTPTHLIMDAWIKGIQFLGVIYYNFIRPEVVSELLEAAEIMGVEIRVGIEFSARMKDKYANLVWAPRGFIGREDFVKFLGDPAVQEFMNQGRVVSEYVKAHILELLRRFNRDHLPGINEEYGLSVRPLNETQFLNFVGRSQASLVHLAEFAHKNILPHLHRRVDELAGELERAGGDERAGFLKLVDSMDSLVPEGLVERFLRPDRNPGVLDPGVPCDSPDTPELLLLNPRELLDRLDALPCRSRITLNPSNLTPADVLELLYDGEGRITHIEIFNLKDWSQGRTEHRSKINQVRRVLNGGNIVEVKRLFLKILRSVEREDRLGDSDRADRMRMILRDIPRFLGFYRHQRLRSRLGSDSASRSRHSRGMGLVVIPTLPVRVRRDIKRNHDRILPVATTVYRHVTIIPRGEIEDTKSDLGSGVSLGGRLRVFGYARKVTWSIGHNSTRLADKGNIATLGGMAEETGNRLLLGSPGVKQGTGGTLRWRHLNTSVKNVAKVVIGFIPAFLTFYLTKDWWLLACFGAVIWFAITGLRNILQSIVGGGGLIRSSLLSWKDYISWGRVADSLMFTGFSVPLLDYLVKHLFLAKGLNVTTATDPILLYTVIALANGIYISSHNTFRGLPPGAIVGNFFRTVLSIPVAIAFNSIIFRIILISGVPIEVAYAGLQAWAAVISKTASDIVAAVIEGAADRQHNLIQRRIDYNEKLAQVHAMYSRLELLFPEESVFELFQNPKKLAATLSTKADDVLRRMSINALDLLYFWMYQPRAETALRRFVVEMSAEDRQVFLHSQRVLTRKRVISEMFLGGLIGKRFERALAFYLSRADRYLGVLANLVSQADRKGPVLWDGPEFTEGQRFLEDSTRGEGK